MMYRDIQSMVFTLLGDPTGRKIPKGEVRRNVNIAQQVLGSLIWNFDRKKFQAINQQDAVQDQADYPTPADLRETIRVLYAGRECTNLDASEWGALVENTDYRAMKGSSQFFMEYEGSLPGRTRIKVGPTPDAALVNGVEIWYYRRPVDFHDLGSYDGAATGGSTTTLVDTAAPYNTTAKQFTDFWKNAHIRLTSGANNGQAARVSTWAPGTSTFTLDRTLPTAIASTHTYEIDQVSILPEYLHHLMGYYSAAMIAPKLQIPGDNFWNYWNEELAALRGRYTDNIRANTPGENMAGVNVNRAQVS